MLVFVVSFRHKELKVGRCMCTRSPCGKSSVKKPGWNLNLVDESMTCINLWDLSTAMVVDMCCACKAGCQKTTIVLDNFSRWHPLRYVHCR